MTRPADRDDSFEQVLRRAPLVEPPASGEACLDAETLAALVEGGLHGAARTAAETHAASCARCQMALATLVRITPEVSASAPAGWWRAPWIRWMTPIVAGAAAVAIWVAVDRQPQADRAVSGAPPADAQPSGAPAPAPPPDEYQKRLEAPKTASNERREAPQPLVTPSLRDRQLAASEDKAADLKKSKDAPPRPLNQTAQAARADAAKEADALSRNAASPAASSPAAPPPPSSPAAPARSPAIAQETMASAKQAAPTASPSQAPRSGQPQPESVAEAQAGALAGGQFATHAESVSITREVVSPDPRVRWRIGGSRVERSVDAGASWTVQAIDATSNVLAGVAVSPQVCWLVGTDGLVLVTTDGATWQRVPPPAAAMLDRVTATSVDAVTVTTADGRVFSTTDRGRTWTRQLP